MPDEKNANGVLSDRRVRKDRRRHGVGLWRRLFPAGPDFMRTLGFQLNYGRKALDAFQVWCGAPTEANVEAVYTIEAEADAVRRDLVTALSGAFDTPLDREDVDDLSQRFDDIVDQVRNTVREATALKATPDEPIRQMITNLQEGITELQHAIGALPKNRHGALEHSAKARHAQRLNQRIYTQALAALMDTDDFRNILRQREVYRLMTRLGEILELSGEELEHAINKLG
jgi:hypothetical protein